jgi:hypothetical protein
MQPNCDGVNCYYGHYIPPNTLIPVKDYGGMVTIYGCINRICYKKNCELCSADLIYDMDLNILHGTNVSKERLIRPVCFKLNKK